MRSSAEIIRQLLIDLGHAEESGTDWPVYVSFMPEDSHQCICVYDTAGNPDGRLMLGGTRIDHQGIQVQIRGLTYLDVWNKANDIALEFDTMGQVLIMTDGGNAYVIHNISRTGTILSLGVEEKEKQRRHYFSINAVITMPNLEDGELLIAEDGQFLIVEAGEFLTTG